MIHYGETICPVCKGDLYFYDTVKRRVLSKNRKPQQIKIRRLRCKNCSRVHRELPNNIIPFKQYEAEIIQGVINEFITPFTKDYEDYPCEMTMFRWIKQYRSKKFWSPK